MLADINVVDIYVSTYKSLFPQIHICLCGINIQHFMLAPYFPTKFSLTRTKYKNC